MDACPTASSPAHSRSLALEGRQLLTGPPTATMTQTITFPNLESLPNVANQALLYFSSTMGTLTEVDVVTSGFVQHAIRCREPRVSKQYDHGNDERQPVDQPPDRSDRGDHPLSHRDLQCLGI